MPTRTNISTQETCVRKLASLSTIVVLALTACSTPRTAAVTTPAIKKANLSAGKCDPNPLGKRDLYLRGSFNSWTAAEDQRFTYLCNRFELVTRISGAHAFKIGDEAWSKDADFGADTAAAGKSWQLRYEGANIHHLFQDTHRIVINMTQPNNPTLSITDCTPPPLGETVLFLRGSMSNWTALEDYAFAYSCDAYYLNVSLSGRHEFKIADALMSSANTLGVDGDVVELGVDSPQVLAAATAGRNANIRFSFNGEHTIRLAYAGNRPVVTIGAKTYADPKVATVSDPLALSLVHNSRATTDKMPFGAVTAGTAVNFSLASSPGVKAVTLVIEKRRMEGNQDVLEYSEPARLPLTKSSTATHERWTGAHTFHAIGIYGYYFEAAIGDKIFVYQNNRDSIYWTREKGANGHGAVDEKPLSSKTIRRFRHTVFDKNFVVPNWAKDVVYYIIFPDRFRNGDKRNDPKPGVTTYQDKSIEFHQNWLDKPYKPKSGDGSDDVYNNDFFGGDLAGTIEKLEYIAELGANAIYMQPVFHAASNHKYDTADYKNIDPHFGSNADFERLTHEAGKRGIRVIPDTSLNHTGSDSIYFDRFEKYKSHGAFENGKVRRDSPYASWYKFDETQTEPNKQYKGWVDVTDLPELNKASPAYREFAYGAKDSVMKLWLDRGAAGWRMDVVPWVPDDFWREWRTAIKRHKPDALTIAETWFDSSKYFLGDTFDTTMNYIFRSTVLDYANGGKARQLYSNLEFIREVYPPQSLYALMNLISSHDVARSLHVFGNMDATTEPQKIQLAKQRLRLAVFFQMIYPGAPAVYYGDEVGVTGGEDPYNRATYPWADLGGKPDLALLADFKTLIKMRNEHAALRHGTLDAPLFIDDNVIVLLRRHGGVIAITATNNAATPQTVSLKLPVNVSTTGFVDALTGARSENKNGTINITVPAMFGTVLISR